MICVACQISDVDCFRCFGFLLFSCCSSFLVVLHKEHEVNADRRRRVSSCTRLISKQLKGFHKKICCCRFLNKNMSSRFHFAINLNFDLCRYDIQFTCSSNKLSMRFALILDFTERRVVV